MKNTLGVIGIGTMGQAFLTCIREKGILDSHSIILFDADITKLTPFDGQYNIAKSVQEVADTSEIILFAVKPQHFPMVTNSLTINDENSILSIMAGVTIEKIRTLLKKNVSVARVMPNTPCQIGKGVCGVCFDGVKEEQKSLIINILSACGKVVPMQEKLLDTVTSISGSGPAYVYMFLDALIEGGVEGGLTFEDSKTLAIETVIGTAEMLKTSTIPLPTLIEKVCSKGGTTIEAVNIYRQKGLENIIKEGITACRNRSIELSKGE